MTVKLLCHFDGTDGQTTTVDSSGDPHTVALSGCTLTTADSKFGGACLDLNSGPASGRAFVMSNPDWRVGAGEFTAEAWVKFEAASTGLHAIIGQWSINQYGWLFTQYGTTLNFYWSTTGANSFDFYGLHTPVVGQWYHYAVDRDASGMVRIYVDGVVKASQLIPDVFWPSQELLSIGNDGTLGRKLPGKLDEARFSDTALYAGAFTPPTAPFPDPPALPPAPPIVKILCHFDDPNGSTTTDDSGLNDHQLTMVGTSISDSGPKFGIGTLTTSPNEPSAKMTTPTGDDFYLGGEEFTIESWVKFTKAPTGAGEVVAAQWGGNNAWYFGLLSGLNFYWTAEASGFQNIAAAFTPILGQWYHLAVDRDGFAMTRLYIDGVVVASASIPKCIVKSSLPHMTVGNDSANGRALGGQLDEFRMMDRAMYGGPFTPPTAPFPDPAESSPPARITQAVMLALGQTSPGARLTQAALLVMGQPTPGAQITQVPSLALVEYFADIRLTQAATLVLADHKPCITRWGTCWTFTLASGEILGYTAHDKTVIFRGVPHEPCNSLSATAVEMSSIVGSPGSIDLAGILSDSGISASDIYNGLLDGARIEVWMVPWDNAGWEIPFRLIAGVVGAGGFGVAEYHQELITESARLSQRALLEIFTPGCRYQFGSTRDSRCPVDLAAITVTGSVTGTTIPNASTDSTRRIFTDSARTEADGFFNLGTIEWTSGPNAGARAEIKDFTAGQFILWESLAFPIAIGDGYTAEPGCDKSEADHLRFNPNMTDFGGFPHLPGQDQIVKTPNAKG